MNFKDMRIAMVEGQLSPNGITDEDVLKAFLMTPRELFLPQEYKHTCYRDEDIHLPNGRSVLDPLTLAKLISGASIDPEDVVLCIGDISGYAAAIVAELASTVVRLEEDPHALAFSEEIYQKLDLTNIVSLQEKLRHGDVVHAPFDKIILCGASFTAPDHLIKQLSYGGSLCYVHKDNPLSLGTIKVILRINEQEQEEKYVGMSATHYCLDYGVEEGFSLEK